MTTRRRRDPVTGEVPDPARVGAQLRVVRARHEYNYSTGEHVLQTVVHRLGVLPTDYVREIVIETLAAAASFAEADERLDDVAAALRWDRDGRPDRPF